MASKSDFFVAIYTNQVKDYASEAFFEHIDFPIGIVVDNSKSELYQDKLRKLTHLPVKRLLLEQNPRETLFQRNVAESVSLLREEFLKTDCKYFLILESDVIITPTFFDEISKSLEKLESLPFEKPWGALGCLYYEGFHDYSKSGINPTHHVLSGATIYRREAIEKYKFRWSLENLGAFPDAWWSIDAGLEYSLWNDHDIKLIHLHNKNGTRYSNI